MQRFSNQGVKIPEQAHPRAAGAAAAPRIRRHARHASAGGDCHQPWSHGQAKQGQQRHRHLCDGWTVADRLCTRASRLGVRRLGEWHVQVLCSPELATAKQEQDQQRLASRRASAGRPSPATPSNSCSNNSSVWARGRRPPAAGLPWQRQRQRRQQQQLVPAVRWRLLWASC